MKHFIFTLTALAVLALAGCASLPPGLAGRYSTSADAYNIGQARQAQNVRLGVVIAVRNVELAPGAGTKAVGSGIGALIGGLVGRQIGGGNGKTVATAAGAIAGAVGGNKVAARTYRQPGLAVTVKLEGGQAIEVTQAADIALHAGQHVEVIGNGWGDSPVRVIPLD
jgi:outer membrane lipoprotein SlyB